MKKHRILVVDDDDIVRNMTAKYLRLNGYEVISAADGKAALKKEETDRPDLVILDIEMPGMSGFEVCEEIRKKREGINYIPIIFLSGLLTEDIIVDGLEMGADDFVTKPFEPIELLARARNLLKMKDFISQVELLENAIFSLVKTIETRDFYTAGHSRRVARIAACIGGEMGLPEEEILILNKSSLLHDIGKLGIPDNILNKTGKFNQEEFTSIKEHPAKGEEICKNLRLNNQILKVIRSHHEKLDGSGYPDGLKGAQLDLLTKIVTVADIFDALTTVRPYRGTKTVDEAVSIMDQEAQEGKLDIAIVNCLKGILASGKLELDK